MAAGYVE